MNKRMLLALGLSAAVIGLTQYLFPPPAPAPKPAAAATAVVQPLAPSAAAAVLPSAVAAAPATIGATATPSVIDTAALISERSSIRISSLGAAPVSIRLNGYKSLLKGIADTAVELVRPTESLLQYALVVKEPGGNRVIDLSKVPFTATRTDDRSVTYAGVSGAANVQITYVFQPDSFLVRVGGKVTGLTSPGFLRVTLPSGLNSSEADTTEDQQHLAVAMKLVRGGNTESIAFNDLDPGETSLKEGPFTWVASKNKFFITGLLTSTGDRPFDEVTVIGGPKTGKVESRVQATALQSLQDGTFRFELYAGPQEWRRLVALGRDFENSNPYGGWLQGFVQPFATMVMKTLLWMHESLHLGYGWVLVIFGIAVRLLLWPFNQRAMRTSMKMQVLQPELQAVQEKYKSDPQKMQAEVMKVYKEHDMSPFSAISGCLPMLLPMPVFITLFFVFQNTIEFRGVPFLYLADISQKDPTYVIPLLMAVSAFALSWIGLRGMPPNPQAKIMGYMFPAMMFAFFFTAAAGLNLYYMVQNIAALPQQWLIANERMKAKPKAVVYSEKGTPAKPKKA